MKKKIISNDLLLTFLFELIISWTQTTVLKMIYLFKISIKFEYFFWRLKMSSWFLTLMLLSSFSALLSFPTWLSTQLSLLSLKSHNLLPSMIIVLYPFAILSIKLLPNWLRQESSLLFIRLFTLLNLLL